MRHTRHTLADVYLKARRHLAANLYDDDTQWLSAANKVETPMRVALRRRRELSRGDTPSVTAPYPWALNADGFEKLVQSSIPANLEA